jgi:hypothetical protein
VVKPEVSKAEPAVTVEKAAEPGVVKPEVSKAEPAVTAAVKAG